MAVHGYNLIVPSGITSTGTSASVSASGKITFTAVSALNIATAFSVDYDNYMIVAQYKGSTSLSITMQLRSSGTAATSDYFNQSLIVDNTTLTAARSSTSSNWPITTIGGTLTCGMLTYLYDPYTTGSTAYKVITCSDSSNVTMYTYCGQHGNANQSNANTLYDGFNINTSTGNITGTMTIYGAKK